MNNGNSYLQRLTKQSNNILINDDVYASSHDDDEEQLILLLQKFNLVEVFRYLNAAKVTYRSLKYMNYDDMKEAIPPLGLRMEFREKLLAWKNGQYQSNNDEINVSTSSETFTSISLNTPVSSTPLRRILSKPLRDLLNNSPEGKALILYYCENHGLNCKIRETLIKIIVEDLIAHDINLKPQDYAALIDEIVSVFKTETIYMDYYYIPRSKKRNPSGKLYLKYLNMRSKKMKLNMQQSNKFIHVSTMSNKIRDNSLSNASKEPLRKSDHSCNEEIDIWRKTFQCRRKNLAELKSLDHFFDNWPIYDTPKAVGLIECDFDMLYPGKSDILFSKWCHFKTKIKEYYEKNVYNKNCKKLLHLLKKDNKAISYDSSNMFITLLLCGVLPPTQRFRNQNGGGCKKATIDDSQESFITHLEYMNDYKKQILDIKNKYFSAGLTIQPFLMGIGSNIQQLESFYVYFNDNLYKFDYFLKSLDVCFKIYQVFKLPYPPACENPWIFIQQYFYNIEYDLDTKTEKLYKLLKYLE